MIKGNDASFASLQDSNEKLCGFLDWLLDAIEVHNCNPRQKPIHSSITTARACSASAQLCDEMSNGRCRARLWPGSGSDMLKGHFTRAKELQADLYNRIAVQSHVGRVLN